MVIGPVIRKYLPYVNFVVASSALCFQIFVLYPWHLALDNDFNKLKEDQSLTLAGYHQKQISRLKKIDENISNLEIRNKCVQEEQKKLDQQQMMAK